jgi:gas vesicle protein
VEEFLMTDGNFAALRVKFAESWINEKNRRKIVKNIIGDPGTGQSLDSVLRDFFKYCGNITHLYTQPSEDGTHHAYITFDHPQSVEMALVLNGSIVNGRSIITERASSLPFPTENIKRESKELPPPLESMSTAMSNLITGGYVLSQEALNKAKEFDEKIKFTEKLKETKDKVQSSVEHLGEQIDEKLHLTQALNDIQTTFKGVEEKLDLGTKTKQIGETTSTFFSTLGSTVSTNVQYIGHDIENFVEKHETLKKGVDQVKSWGNFISTKTKEVVGTIGDVVDETKSKVEENVQNLQPKVEEKIQETKTQEEIVTKKEEQVYPQIK